MQQPFFKAATLFLNLKHLSCFDCNGRLPSPIKARTFPSKVPIIASHETNQRSRRLYPATVN
ncbi:hypothetical protein F383_02057 [Gossypium arboreum]|uniref:Uncharacterized protein n=1 Tax=Gossypium arboreum TaxID=29729 RepID=A0A0B0PD06_GOSAR|nr:hypothetical protein F383_04592 [Gossypium arboreum]KHG22815.1 hypothetical protein F383_02057 [Gossypium arboreum]